jgi:hypothetical protein
VTGIIPERPTVKLTNDSWGLIFWASLIVNLEVYFIIMLNPPGIARTVFGVVGGAALTLVLVLSVLLSSYLLGRILHIFTAIALHKLSVVRVAMPADGMRVYLGITTVYLNPQVP